MALFNLRLLLNLPRSDNSKKQCLSADKHIER